jgi:hypothetical protein
VGIVLISLLPALIEALRARRESRQTQQAAEEQSTL